MQHAEIVLRLGEALLRGDLDVVQLFEPFVSDLVESGRGHIWYAAANRGLATYTTFYARRGLLAARRLRSTAAVLAGDVCDALSGALAELA